MTIKDLIAIASNHKQISDLEIYTAIEHEEKVKGGALDGCPQIRCKRVEGIAQGGIGLLLFVGKPEALEAILPFSSGKRPSTLFGDTPDFLRL